MNKLNFLTSLIVVAISAFSAFSQETYKVQVVGVVSGDNLTVMDLQHRQMSIYLAGIDAPEIDQEYGIEARAYLISLIQQKKATLDCIKPDTEGKRICRLAISNKDLSLTLIESGFAWSDNNDPSNVLIPDFSIYQTAEKTARTAKKGLWNSIYVISPREFRAAMKAQQEQRERLAAERRDQMNNRVIIENPPGYNSGAGVFDGTSGGSSSDKTVHVRGYTRSDGTQVNSYDRSAPSRKH